MHPSPEAGSNPHGAGTDNIGLWVIHIPILAYIPAYIAILISVSNVVTITVLITPL